MEYTVADHSLGLRYDVCHERVHCQQAQPPMGQASPDWVIFYSPCTHKFRVFTMLKNMCTQAGRLWKVNVYTCPPARHIGLPYVPKCDRNRILNVALFMSEDSVRTFYWNL